MSVETRASYMNIILQSLKEQARTKFEDKKLLQEEIAEKTIDWLEKYKNSILKTLPPEIKSCKVKDLFKEKKNIDPLLNNNNNKIDFHTNAAFNKLSFGKFCE